jgi:hypothetical protein
VDAHDRHVAIDYGHLAMHIAALIFAVFFAVLVLYVALAPVKATAFDADGTRCYHRAISMTCIQTARP